MQINWGSIQDGKPNSAAWSGTAEFSEVKQLQKTKKEEKKDAHGPAWHLMDR